MKIQNSLVQVQKRPRFSITKKGNKKMRIYKYPLEVTDTQIILLPESAQILCVQA